MIIFDSTIIFDKVISYNLYNLTMSNTPKLEQTSALLEQYNPAVISIAALLVVKGELQTTNPNDLENHAKNAKKLLMEIGVESLEEHLLFDTLMSVAKALLFYSVKFKFDSDLPMLIPENIVNSSDVLLGLNTTIQKIRDRAVELNQRDAQLNATSHTAKRYAVLGQGLVRNT
jgi:hypothetical protein